MADEPQYDSKFWSLLKFLGVDVDSWGRDALDVGTTGGTPDIRPWRHMQAHQYQHPEEDVLPPAKYRPTSLTKFQNQPFRSMAAYMPEAIYLPEDRPTWDQLKAAKSPTVLDEKDVVSIDSSLSDIFNRSVSLNKHLGLGSARNSLGFDHARNKPYLSVFDSFDFDKSPGSQLTDNLSIGRELVEKAGKPFNVYDRIYLEPSDLTYGQIPTRNRREALIGDIELPAPVKGLKSVKKK